MCGIHFGKGDAVLPLAASGQRVLQGVLAALHRLLAAVAVYSRYGHRSRRERAALLITAFIYLRGYLHARKLALCGFENADGILRGKLSAAVGKRHGNGFRIGDRVERVVSYGEVFRRKHGIRAVVVDGYDGKVGFVHALAHRVSCLVVRHLYADGNGIAVKLEVVYIDLIGELYDELRRRIGGKGDLRDILLDICIIPDSLDKRELAAERHLLSAHREGESFRLFGRKRAYVVIARAERRIHCKRSRHADGKGVDHGETQLGVAARPADVDARIVGVALRARVGEVGVFRLYPLIEVERRKVLARIGRVLFGICRRRDEFDVVDVRARDARREFYRVAARNEMHLSDDVVLERGPAARTHQPAVARVYTLVVAIHGVLLIEGQSARKSGIGRGGDDDECIALRFGSYVERHRGVIKVTHISAAIGGIRAARKHRVFRLIDVRAVTRIERDETRSAHGVETALGRAVLARPVYFIVIVGIG